MYVIKSDLVYDISNICASYNLLDDLQDADGQHKGKKKDISVSNTVKDGKSGKTYSRRMEVSRKHPSDSQPLTAEEARQLQMEWMKR